MSTPGDAQGVIDSTTHPSVAPNMGAATTMQDYTGYSSYSTSTTTMQYTYPGQEYQNYYYAYQQPATNVSSQQVGTNQTTGAAYQPLSSFQNSGSYVNPTSYIGTYPNAGDNQTTTGYGQSSYNYQNNSWNDANAGNYAAHHYPNYAAPDANSVPASNAVSTNSNPYQQPYNQWSYYYGQPAPGAVGATGTDHSSVTNATSAGYSAAGVSVGYTYTSPQPPPPGTTTWRSDSATSAYPAFQEREAVTTYPSNPSWQSGASGIQTNHINQSTYYQMPFNSNPPPFENNSNEQKVLSSQISTLQHSSSSQVENLQQPLHTFQTADVRQASKVQIPVNPRIAPISTVGAVKTQKESSAANAVAKPAYLSVSVPKPANNLSNQEDAQAATKGTLPASLRAYVERSFARCKDDAQRIANEKIMREIISKATADGTLISKNWDIEPLFPLQNGTSDILEQSNTKSVVSVFSLSKNKRSPNRRVKSRWEPVAEEKAVDNISSADTSSAKDVRTQAETSEKRGSGKSYVSNTNDWSGKYFSPQQQAALQKYIQRPTKRPRPSYTSNTTESADASSDSDKEQNLTKYYASAITLANSPEEKKRREHRFKRFEVGQGSQIQSSYSRQKNTASGNTYPMRASAMLLAKHYDEGSGMAVEDINWDALTVKGTCQEIEKRYLRLTSAPDPATVRPEAVLEKALKMVQASAKNYLYKCDQLKSIRQDLTVQRIQNTLTVKVYETHARLALEAGDLPEYNQCASQLKRLYAEGIEGCYMEFSAYNLLCIILHSNNKRELLSSMARLSDEAKHDVAVKHALAVRSAVSSGNYVLFFSLYKAAPNLNMCLMDLYIEKIRFEAIKCMCKSYRPYLPVVYIAEILGFVKSLQTEDGPVNGVDGSEECEEWLRAHGAILTIDNSGELQLDAKASSSSLFMPEPDDAVAHGDANLAVDDFLARAS